LLTKLKPIVLSNLRIHEALALLAFFPKLTKNHKTLTKRNTHFRCQVLRSYIRLLVENSVSSVGFVMRIHNHGMNGVYQNRPKRITPVLFNTHVKRTPPNLIPFTLKSISSSSKSNKLKTANYISLTLSTKASKPLGSRKADSH
jgi:hypothetical protein